MTQTKVAIIISMMNQKGGAGKTTTSQHASLCLASMGKKVLFIDTDVQRSAYKFFLRNHKLFPNGYDGVIDVLKCTVEALAGNLDNHRHEYDFIFIDTKPVLEAANTTLITLSDIIVIPTQPRFKDIESTEEIVNLIHQIKINKPNLIAQFVLTRTKSGQRLKKHTDKLEAMNLPMFKTTFRQYDLYEDADEQGIGIIHLEKGQYVDKAAQDVHQFTNELLTLAEGI